MTLERAVRRGGRSVKIPWSWAARLGALTFIVWGAVSLHAYLSAPSKLPAIQHITLVSPAERALPPPPPPQVPATPQPELKTPLSHEHEDTTTMTFGAPGPPGPRTPGGGASGPLGLAGEDEGAGDTFGLVSRPGGREITTLHEGPGDGEGGGGGEVVQQRLASTAADFNYGPELKHSLEVELNKHDELRMKTYRAVLILAISGEGLVTNLTMVQSTGDDQVDKLLRAALMGSKVKTPPHEQPTRRKIAVNSQWPKKVDEAP